MSTGRSRCRCARRAKRASCQVCSATLSWRPSASQLWRSSDFGRAEKAKKSTILRALGSRSIAAIQPGLAFAALARKLVTTLDAMAREKVAGYGLEASKGITIARRTAGAFRCELATCPPAPRRSGALALGRGPATAPRRSSHAQSRPRLGSAPEAAGSCGAFLGAGQCSQQILAQWSRIAPAGLLGGGVFRTGGEIEGAHGFLGRPAETLPPFQGSARQFQGALVLRGDGLAVRIELGVPEGIRPSPHRLLQHGEQKLPQGSLHPLDLEAYAYRMAEPQHPRRPTDPALSRDRGVAPSRPRGSARALSRGYHAPGAPRKPPSAATPCEADDRARATPVRRGIVTRRR